MQRILHDNIPRQEARKELRARYARGRLTGDRVKYLFLQKTRDLEEAENQEAFFLADRGNDGGRQQH